MNPLDKYIELVVYGLKNHFEYLPDYLKRECKKMEISEKEFSDNIELVLTHIKLEIKQNHRKRLGQFNKSKKKNGKEPLIDEEVVYRKDLGFDMSLIDYVNDGLNEMRVESMEPMPDINFESDPQKIAWLHELGIIDLLYQRTKGNDLKTANIITSITGLQNDKVRKSVAAILKSGNDQKNNPLRNKKNQLSIDLMLNKFKLDKRSK